MSEATIASAAIAAQLQADVLDVMKRLFVGKDEIIDLLGVCLVGGENLFMLGPPGTAKSALVQELGHLIDGRTFDYLLTRFTEPNELFGPFDIRRLREGDLVTNTEGMLPEAHLIFLDELLNANSAILNSLLLVLNERIFRRGRETRPLPTLMVVGASNQLPEDEALRALFDRFLIRVHCDNVAPALLSDVLDAGWALEQHGRPRQATVSADDIHRLQRQVAAVELGEVRGEYLTLVQHLRNAGAELSDRRAVKLQRLIAASALLCGRQTARVSDFWVLRYIWDSLEQQEVIAAIVDEAVAHVEAGAGDHPRARAPQAPDAEELSRELEALAERWQAADVAPAEQAVLKDRLRHLASRCEWVHDETQRQALQEQVDDLWRRIVKD